MAVSEILSTFAFAFEKYTFSKQLKKEFFERFYINRQVVQEAVNFLEASAKVLTISETAKCFEEKLSFFPKF